MAIAKRKDVVTAEQRMVADRVDRARRANPARDPTGEHHEACREIADATGADVVNVLDDWDYRAAIREYEAGVSRVDAERLAVDDVRDQYTKQSKLKL